MLVSVKQGWEQIAKKLKSISDNFKWEKCIICKEDWSKLPENKICPDCEKEKKSAKHRELVEEEKRKQLTFENFKITKDNEEIYNLVKSFLSNENGIYLYGKAGRGKTHLLLACYNKLKDSGKSVKFIIVPNLLIDIRKTYAHINTEDTTEADILNSCVEPEYLFLDELREKGEFCFQILFVILNQREAQHKNKIFITSNYPLKDIAKLDDRISSRITGMCSQKNIKELTGKDWRIK